MSHMKERELHLFIIWSNARRHSQRILDDLKGHFRIIDVFEITWSDEHFSQNMTRFYGQNLPEGSFKEQHVGRGPFLLVILEDPEPKYDWRETSQGSRLVNIKTFDLKERYRSWTGGGHKIHATNDVQEFRHDLALLLGIEGEKYISDNGVLQPWSGEVTRLSRDLAGAAGWNSLYELFFILNNTVQYVVLRNFDALPDQWDSSIHGDIDFLVRNLKEALYIFNASKVFSEIYRVHYKIIVDNQDIFIDLRHVGDNYYDSRWEEDILKDRICLDKILFVPSEQHHFYSLLYHCHVHKDQISPDYPDKLTKLAQDIGLKDITNENITDRISAFQILKKFLDENGYYFTKPDDISVYFNASFVMIESENEYPDSIELIYSRLLCEIYNISYESKIFKVNHKDESEIIRKLATGHLSAREYYYLSLLKKSRYFPRIFRCYIGRNFSVIDMKYIEADSFQELSKREIPCSLLIKIAYDCLNILKELKDAKILHRDITPDNLLLHEDTPVLMDFQWAISPDMPGLTPMGLGKEGKPPSGDYDDIYSMGMTLKYLDKQSILSALTSAMTEEDQSNRVQDIDQLFIILDNIKQNILEAKPLWKDHRHSYKTWLSKRKIIPEFFNIEAQNWTRFPVFSIYLNFGDNQTTKFADTIESISNQIYTAFKLIVISPFDCINPLFHEEENLEWIKDQGSYWHNINQHIAKNNCDWALFLESGDILHPHALASLTSIINQMPNKELIYFDHDILDGQETPYPIFKPDFNIDYLRSFNYINKAFSITKEKFIEIGGFNPKLRFAECHDLLLKASESLSEDQVHHINDILISINDHNLDHDEENLKNLATRLSVQQHLDRQNIIAQTIQGPITGSVRCIYDYSDQPLVSIIIPTKNQSKLLKKCIQSLINRTIYKNYEIIIVDNGSDEEEALLLLKQLKEEHKDKITILKYEKKFNYSEANNLAAQKAKGDYLLFLNNDIEIIQENWLNILMSYCQRQDTGAVGPKLLFPDGRIQHAGVGVGLFGAADHFFIGCAPHEGGYMDRLLMDQNLSAVTAACLLVKREAFDQVGGMDQENYQINFSDVDFCLKLRAAGYKITWTPHATLIHHTSATQRAEITDDKRAQQAKIQFEKDKQSLFRKWFPELCHDPASNIHCDLGSRYFELDVSENPVWNPTLASIPRLWGFPRAKDGAGEYRIRRPLLSLQEGALAMVHIAKEFLIQNAIERHKPDTLIFQTPVTEKYFLYLKDFRRVHPGLMIFELDDLLHHIPYKNPAFPELGKKNMKRMIAQALRYCDRMVVSTRPLAEAYSGLCKDIRIVPNYLSKNVWGKVCPTKRTTGDKPRVGWAGGAFHYGDLMVIKDVIKDLAGEIDWIFMGMCPDEIRPYVAEYHEGVDIDRYPEKLASLNLDLAVAPLEINAFNRAKSNLRILEYGILGWPVIATDIYPYQGAPVTLVKNRYKAWKRAIMEKLSDRQALAKEGEELRNWVLSNWMLEDHLEEILEAYI